MKLKIAAMLLVSVLMSANTSYGDLLDRMLGRAGCSSCAAPAAKGCGGGGLMDKLLSCQRDSRDRANILNVDPASSCGCDTAPVTEASPCGCGASPFVEASPCGCDAAPVAEASPCGSDTVVAVSPCGCDAAPMVEASPCGCDAAPVAASSCGCDAAPIAASSCGCDAAPIAEASPCGCNAAPMVEASPCGCDAAPVAASSCGCDAAPVVGASSCGCDSAPAAAAAPCGSNAAPAGLLDLLRRNCGFGSGAAAKASSCGCEAGPMAASHTVFASSPEMVSPFASHAATADSGCGSDGGFLSRLRGMGKSSCGSAPAVATSDCGCDAAPAVSTCGCGAAPAVSTCGCGAPGGSCGSGGGRIGRPKLSLMDRLKGNRVPRDRNGRVIGVSNDGCNPPCPTQPNAGCGCGSHVETPYVETPYVEAAPCSSCSTCGGGEVIYSDAVPVSGCADGSCGSTPIYGSAVALPAAAAATSEGSGSRVDPVPPPTTERTIQETEEVERRDVTQPSISDDEDDPIVDPGAFVPRSTNTMGS